MTSLNIFYNLSKAKQKFKNIQEVYILQPESVWSKYIA